LAPLCCLPGLPLWKFQHVPSCLNHVTTFPKVVFPKLFAWLSLC
jgi:hypothetical protein